MVRPKKETKTKTMFKPYNAKEVPDVMPFPELALVATTKGEETAVPKLNEYQRSWILDVALRGVDLPNLSAKATRELYNKIKTDAFDAKAFKHTPTDGDKVEEARLPALVAAWKLQKKKGKAADDDVEDSDEDEDEDGQATLLRGYSRSGWRTTIQKVVSNKRTAEKRKAKTKVADSIVPSPEVSAHVLSTLFGLAAYGGRDKFREDHHDEIHEFSKTLPGSSNAGGKFRQAEAKLWAQEDQASWDAAATSEEGVNWAERQKLVASGFKHFVSHLHGSRKFRPFVATMLMGWLGTDDQVHFEWQVFHSSLLVDMTLIIEVGPRPFPRKSVSANRSRRNACHSTASLHRKALAVAGAEGHEDAEREHIERVEQEHVEQEHVEQERVEQERVEQERVERERGEQERVEQERAEQERAEQERVEQERVEQERVERERGEQEHAEQERIERERIECVEQERVKQERVERERVEQERVERERGEQEHAEQERIERERIECVEQERVEQERVERAERERVEQGRLEAEGEEDTPKGKKRKEAKAEREKNLAAMLGTKAKPSWVLVPVLDTSSPPKAKRAKRNCEVKKLGSKYKLSLRTVTVQ
ncbi:hypothetical protein B0H12DRAFT_1080324 [Mycena haematopus]|nr:hypothetical protein B0H12DRAFT_1080324 [Mycena haematopus]